MIGQRFSLTNTLTKPRRKFPKKLKSSQESPIKPYFDRVFFEYFKYSYQFPIFSSRSQLPRISFENPRNHFRIARSETMEPSSLRVCTTKYHAFATFHHERIGWKITNGRDHFERFGNPFETSETVSNDFEPEVSPSHDFHIKAHSRESRTPIYEGTCEKRMPRPLPLCPKRASLTNLSITVWHPLGPFHLRATSTMLREFNYPVAATTSVKVMRDERDDGHIAGRDPMPPCALASIMISNLREEAANSSPFSSNVFEKDTHSLHLLSYVLM